MIIYDTNFNFLGMSSSVLSLLGYSDVSSFLETNNDVADLFIKKPGFIHKFNNFSWISYILNGATPNKVVSMKLKNGNELQATINITEIQSKDSDEKLYVIELQNTVVIPVEQVDADVEPEKKENIFKMFDNDNSDDVKFNTTEDNEPKTTIFGTDADTTTDTKNTVNTSDDFILESFDFIKENKNDDDVSLLSTDEKTDELEGVNENDLLILDNDDTTPKVDFVDGVDGNVLPENSEDMSENLTISFDGSENIFSNVKKTTTKNNLDDTETIVENVIKDYGFDRNQVKEYFDDYSLFVSEEFSKLDRYLENEDNELLNAEIVKLIGASNVLKFEDIAQKLTEAKLTSLFKKKKEIINNIKSNISDLTNVR